MLDNLKRGQRTIFWTKVNIVLSVLVVVLAISFYRVIEVLETHPEADPLSMGVLLGLLAFGVVGFALVISVCIQALFWLLWMFRAEENLRRCTTTAFSPWGAVICCSLPYVGTLLHFFVFRNLVRRMEVALAERRKGDSSTYAPAVPMNLVIGYFVCSLLGGVAYFVSGTPLLALSCYLLWIASAVCYIKALSAYMRQERELAEIYKDEELRAKVDEVLREREIEKAAREVQAASYESENPKDEG